MLRERVLEWGDRFVKERQMRHRKRIKFMLSTRRARTKLPFGGYHRKSKFETNFELDLGFRGRKCVLSIDNQILDPLGIALSKSVFLFS